MTAGDPPPPPRTEAVVRRSRWPGLVWAIPLAALAVVAWLGLRALTHRGVTVHLDVQAAAGVRTGDTHVTYNGMEVGVVRHIGLAPDGRLIRLTLHINPDMRGMLRTGTRFWVVGAHPNLTDLSALRATVSGPSIGLAPGPGAPRRDFRAVERGPAVAPGTAGTRFRLMAPDVVSIEQGTSIYTHGWQVGTVLGVSAFGRTGFVLDAFVRAPYDRLVRTSSHFWDASAVELTRAAGGLEARLTSPEIAAVGGVMFETPKEALDAPPAPAGRRFQLYPDAAEAGTAPVGAEVPYAVLFSGAVGELERGAPVKLRGFTVGRVLGTALDFDRANGAVTTTARLALDPTRLHLPENRQSVDALVRSLVAHGWRARLAQSPPLVGAELVELARVPGARAAALRGDPSDPLLPAAASGDASDITAKADDILTKVDALPIAAIGRNLRQATGNLARVTGSPQVQDSLNHLDRTLATLDRTVQANGPKVGPLIDSLSQAAAEAQAAAAAAGNLLGTGGAGQDADLPSAIRQLTEATRSVRSLTDYLSRHPEALIRGKRRGK